MGERLNGIQEVSGSIPLSSTRSKEIGAILKKLGFDHQHGSVYFGKVGTIDAVGCVMAAQQLAIDLPWFANAVRDIRMLRIEDANDLGPAIAQAMKAFKQHH